MFLHPIPKLLLNFANKDVCFATPSLILKKTRPPFESRKTGGKVPAICFRIVNMIERACKFTSWKRLRPANAFGAAGRCYPVSYSLTYRASGTLSKSGVTGPLLTRARWCIARVPTVYSRVRSASSLYTDAEASSTMTLSNSSPFAR